VKRKDVTLTLPALRFTFYASQPTDK